MNKRNFVVRKTQIHKGFILTVIEFLARLKQISRGRVPEVHDPRQERLQNTRKLKCEKYSLLLSIGLVPFASFAAAEVTEPVRACVIDATRPLDTVTRSGIEHCLGWRDNPQVLCQGDYTPISVITPEDEAAIHLSADYASFHAQDRSRLKGHVEVQHGQHVITAETATIYRDAKSQQITRIAFTGNVHYQEPGRLMIARELQFDPRDKSGTVQDVLYRFSTTYAQAVLPAWGRAKVGRRWPNHDFSFEKVTYTTCRPTDKAWHIGAKSIYLNEQKHTGTARDAVFYVRDHPLFYSPYLTFPTSKERKSGFLMPTKGYSNIGGFDFSLPYYLNLAPNYDATIVPHVYTERGVMMGGEFRYLLPQSFGVFNANFLPADQAYRKFLKNDTSGFPGMNNSTTNRWSVDAKQGTDLSQNAHFNFNYQQVSDNYYLQDFSSNLAILTERQLHQEGDLTWNSDHWFLRGMLERYQTLQPINESLVADIYQRLPQLMANGFYADLPWHGNLSILGQYDQFHWPGSQTKQVQGPRLFVNPVLAFPQIKAWGYVTPSVELVQNYYSLSDYSPTINQQEFSKTIPRYSVDSGLYFDRNMRILNRGFTQTLEPRLYYLKVPYANQTPIPVFESAYMIFNMDQVFRTNRFSGFDRIGDTNQLSYAVTSRFLTDETGFERANLSLGQIYYFADRQVQLCQSPTGYCIQPPVALGYLSSTAQTSPIAARATYYFNPVWAVTSDYIWDTATKSTNNGHIDVRYQGQDNRLLSLGYTYIVNGDFTQVANSTTTLDVSPDNPLHQASVAAAWPLNDHWSGLGAYNYNISKQYEMMAFLGVQYDSCCWAMRLMGGKVFQSLNPQLQPQYNNNVYLQILWKGLGTVGNSDPASTIHTFLPGYADKFH